MNPLVRYVAIAEEGTFGTEVTADKHKLVCDAASSSLDVPADQAILWEGISSRAPRQYAEAPYIPGGDIVFPPDAHVLGKLLKWALGSYGIPTITDKADEIITHTFSPANTLQSFTADIGKDTFEHTFVGCMVNTLELNMPKGDFLGVTAGVIGSQDKKNTLLSSISYTEIDYFNFIHASLELDGACSVVESCNLSINNNLSGDDGVRLGSKFPVNISIGKRDIEFKADLAFDDDTYLQKFWGGASGPTGLSEYVITLTFTGTLIGGANYYKLTISLPVTIVTGIAQTIEGRSRIVQPITCKAIHDTVTGYDISVELVNTYEDYRNDVELNFHGVNAYDIDNAFAVASRGGIVGTTNKGVTWAEQTSGIDTRLRAVSFLSADVGWAVGDSGVILKTTDGGDNWTAQSSGVTKDLYGVIAFSATEIWAVGMDGTILNGDGTDWTAQASGVTYDLFSIDAQDGIKLMTCGEAGKVLITTNGGTDWTEKDTGITDDLYGISYPALNVAWACGEDGKIVTTPDAGANWSEDTSGITDDLYSVDMVDADVGWAVGNSGVILVTADGGGTWAEQTSGVSEHLRGISAVNSNVAWAVGSGETRLNTVNAGVLWSAQTVT